MPRFFVPLLQKPDAFISFNAYYLNHRLTFRQHTMRKALYIAALAAICIYCQSCARGITPYEAAHGKARCGRTIR